MEQSKVQIIIYALIFAGLFLYFAPPKYQAYIPIKLETSTRQILGAVAFLTAYYYYNGEKLF